ncbi:MAG: anthranilate phosphoribosyltransferase [Verrucomicrobia bacterium]|nr:anthranilate phosphoribosyltransferase [Verrucomicrobiota bacterium]
MLRPLIQHLEQGDDLTEAQVTDAVELLIEEMVPVEQKADFLAQLARKGETAAEILAFGRELRARAIRPVLSPEVRAREIVDVCGTGGDRLNTFNISTTVSLLVAAAGVCVAKHGNRAVTSKTGSADVLEALGIPITLAPDEATQWLRRHNFAFLFAPNFHPAFKHIAPARRLCSTRGVRTIFNFLGPLLNPAQPTAQLIGVPHPDLCEPVAIALKELGARRGMVVSGKVRLAYLDEFSPIGENTVVEFHEGSGFLKSNRAPIFFPLRPCTLGDLQGGDPAESTRIVTAILSGEERGPKRDVVLMNAAAALYIAGEVPALLDGWHAAAQVIDSGRAEAKLHELAQAGKDYRERNDPEAPRVVAHT